MTSLRNRLPVPLLLLSLAATALSCAHTGPPVPLRIPVVAALYAETDSVLFEGTSFLVSGLDRDLETFGWVPGRSTILGIATTGDPARIEGRLSHQMRNNVEGTGGDPSIGQVTEGPDLDELARRYAEAADLTVPGGVYADLAWGGLDDYRVVRVTGDLRMDGPLTGGGVLLVEGDFTCTGVFTWFGLILVHGDMVLSVYTGGGVHILGSLLIQGGGGQQLISGNVDVLYSRDAIRRVNDLNESRPGLEAVIWDAP